MNDILFTLPDKHRGKSKEELSVILDDEIDAFSHYMSTIGDWKSVGPLSKSERALIKTYLIQKLKESLGGSYGS